jgi:uncharacterized protein YqeY
MPDLNEIARQIVQFLAPFLPYLLKAGEKAAEEAGRKLGAAAWEQAGTLWARLRHKKNVEQVAQTVAALPDNQALREALREEIARALAEDPALREEALRLMQSEVVQRVLAEGGSQIRDVVQEAKGGPTTQEVQARQSSTVENVRQIRRR